jgi:hypothetical protein
MGLPNGVHHLAIATRDIKAQIDLRAHGHWVMGPIDHGMCQSIYLTAPEGLMLEFATSAAPIDADEWIDPEVVALCGISAEELAWYRRPPAFASQGGRPAADPHAKPNSSFGGRARAR